MVCWESSPSLLDVVVMQRVYIHLTTHVGRNSGVGLGDLINSNRFVYVNFECNHGHVVCVKNRICFVSISSCIRELLGARHGICSVEKSKLDG